MVKDAYDLGYDVLNMWRVHSMKHTDAGVAKKELLKVPCYVITEHGIDPVKGIYYDPTFGLMIDGRLK